MYNIAHFSKHFQGGGSGIRSVMDIYIMNNAMPDMNEYGLCIQAA